MAIGQSVGAAGATGAPGSSYIVLGGLPAIWCANGQQCIAVGSAPNAMLVEKPLVEVSRGGVWSVVPQADLPVLPPGTTYATLTGLSCTSLDNCMAVGSYIEGTAVKTLVERLSGSTWSLSPSPTPPSQAPVTSPPSPGAGGYAELGKVSCATASNCMAVGFNFINFVAGTQTTLAEHWDGSAWSVVPTPDLPSNGFADIACPSASMCMAVGTYMDKAGTQLLLAERWDGTSWSVLPVPAAVSAPRFLGVSCPSTTICMAVGRYGKPGASQGTLAERWNGSGWHMLPSPKPPGSGVPGLPVSVTSVTCTSVSSCVAVGSYNTGQLDNAVGYNLIETWDGSKWALVPAPNVPGVRITGMLSVSCPSPSTCTASGDYGVLSGGAIIDWTLVERWTGSSWALVGNPS